MTTKVHQNPILQQTIHDSFGTIMDVEDRLRHNEATKYIHINLFDWSLYEKELLLEEAEKRERELHEKVAALEAELEAAQRQIPWEWRVFWFH